MQRVVYRMMGERRATPRDGANRGRRASDVEPMRGWRPALWIALGVALADWAVKFAITRTMAQEEFREVIPNAVALWHVRNHAMILGLWDNLPLGGRKVLALVASMLGVLVLMQIMGRAHRLSNTQRRWAWLFVGMICGGMLGNLGERVIHWGVTDYLSFRWGPYWLPPGNVADIALFLSIPLALPIIGFELMGRARRGRTVKLTAAAPPLATPAAAD
ncbi:signal peptidase II [Longimicrobium terrae]|uniref:Signal peptidase II n=1 Tax=Longimicrobium terrae TaxID=1639882 RepID=A0A841GTZ7_9BACT|nr:signal peptidase II [Longimicrobium terrae]MBB4634392.1 signal peptidase II [Longimicrobium terrae]MBB6068718.1 signal peptidase II [Longimicrobium terrae]NNC27904.1 signal peptidase II [Longimicrobium terrae]